jgi:hypothetical protein
MKNPHAAGLPIMCGARNLHSPLSGHPLDTDLVSSILQTAWRPSRHSLPRTARTSCLRARRQHLKSRDKTLSGTL